MPEFVVTPEHAGQRLDQFLVEMAGGTSRSRIQALIHDGHATLNHAPSKPNTKLRAEDRVALETPEALPVETLPEELPLDILFEDHDLLVLNKAPGMVVHPAAGNQTHTLVNALLHHCGTLSNIGGEQRPGIVHRLDKDTSGCLVVAKNDAAHVSLAEQFGGRSIDKIYLAIVNGVPCHPAGTIETAIGRHPVNRKQMAVVPAGKGKPAKTGYRIVERFPGAALVECRLFTGRTHQIRVHMKHLGHPLLGDSLYGRAAGAPRQMLHAWKLGFQHPRTAENLCFEAPLPTDFLKFLYK